MQGVINKGFKRSKEDETDDIKYDDEIDANAGKEFIARLTVVY